jgi:hypothetical protein
MLNAERRTPNAERRNRLGGVRFGIRGRFSGQSDSMNVIPYTIVGIMLLSSRRLVPCRRLFASACLGQFASKQAACFRMHLFPKHASASRNVTPDYVDMAPDYRRHRTHFCNGSFRKFRMTYVISLRLLTSPVPRGTENSAWSVPARTARECSINCHWSAPSSAWPAGRRCLADRRSGGRIGRR